MTEPATEGTDTAAPHRVLRRAARVAILAPDGSIFLFRYDNPEVGVHWAMPGGGLEGDETHREGAVREAREETGWTDIEPGPLLCTWEHDFTRVDTPVRQHEHIYVAYAPHRPLAGDLAEAHGADRILHGRWWTPAELAATDDALWPPRLPALLADLREHGPAEPAPDLGHVPNGPRRTTG
ncbi:NUDIX hydrolase [Streptomyces sp. CBMA29]|uniref:NUDIX hydrolase n=1 Tax=Streptomyces sp. CBMA29 TaxID=1896314 RepID=UPI0016620444|nr:NUDIX domain-containing protein [Streptomyces sp. CBMA29]MBD0735927.1 NUDIX hydrolase [Streptomyces sp. CBMA29]